MSTRVYLLSGLLALQVVIIAVVLRTGGSAGAADAGPLLVFPAERVDVIRIGTTEHQNGAEVRLSRADGGWQLAAGFPADTDKVNEVLAKLAGLRAGWPVASSAGAGERFQVAPGDHQRHVVLEAGGEIVGELYLGTSPGFQRVHARRADDASIFSVALSNYQLPVTADDWLDKTLLQPRGAVSSVTRRGAWSLVRSDDGWRLDGVAADQQAARQFERRLTELRVSGLAPPPEQNAEPAAVFEINDAAGAHLLRIFAGASGNDHRLSSDRRDGYFSLAAYLAEQLLVDGQSLLAAEQADAGIPTATAGDS
ncbi:MAG: DUF4340 domain-containing protein [Pseudomonadales bacterium]